MTGPNWLIVEGETEKRLIPEVIEQSLGVTWAPNPNQYLVRIEAAGGYNSIMYPPNQATPWIDTVRKASNVRAVGFCVDADSASGSRWESLRKHISDRITESPPAELPQDGWVGDVHWETPNRPVRIGVWIMPDNRSAGDFESWVALLGARQTELWKHAETSVEKAAGIGGATFKPETQTAKAQIHTWLAWQDEPGRQLHAAVKERILNAANPSVQPFVDWFRRLYRL
jgi:hypothetical protein